MVDPTPTPTPASALAVGDPARRPAGRAVFGSLTLAILFVLALLPAPALPTMWSNGPWAQDPYHVVVSFAVLLVPLVSVVCASRVPLCRRYAPLSARRVRDLLRVSRILLILVFVTVASAWISVAWPAQRYSWTGGTVAAFAELAILTIGLLGAGRLLWRASRPPIPAAAGPDWLADVITLGERVSSRLGALRPHALAAVRWLDRRVIAGLRRYPLSAAATLAAVLGIATATSQGVQEGYSPGGYLLFFMVTTLGVFAFVTIAGQQLGLVANERQPPATARNAVIRKCLVHAVVAGSASAPVSIAFRSVIWSALGISERRAGWPDFNELVLGVAAVTAIVAVAAELLVSLARRRRAA
jgi:hypothetical protein